MALEPGDRRAAPPTVERIWLSVSDARRGITTSGHFDRDDPSAEELKQPVTVQNIPGAAGNIAADQTANADPDGYVVGMLTGANIMLRPMLYRNLPYDPLKKLVPVSLIYSFTNGTGTVVRAVIIAARMRD